jgi:hypothetical protein|nr:MAG TPA: hypothetical protein [Caudoviricetes sp.]
MLYPSSKQPLNLEKTAGVNRPFFLPFRQGYPGVKRSFGGFAPFFIQKT